MDPLDALPAGVTISTMSATCKLGTTVDIALVHKHLTLSDTAVLSIKYGDSFRSMAIEKRRDDIITNIDTALELVDIHKAGLMSKPDTIEFNNFNNALNHLVNTVKASPYDVSKKSKKKKKQKKNTSFFNQITTEISTSSTKKVNVKLFCNGSVQMTGCKTVSDCTTAIDKLIKVLKSINGTTTVCDEKELGMHHFKIDMINSNFRIDYKINRQKMHDIIKEQYRNDAFPRYESNAHACVDIKYFKDNDNKRGISIFAFESGNIIITGAKNRQHIIIAHQFITDFLSSHDVKKVDIEDILNKK
jgi:TATA-box binding protein (TBP) (component of TFIID and TFIIIB)